tara:strand:- start:32 stop:175 length:144 start_codon:yes stop_codon:yes gene_type:complete
MEDRANKGYKNSARLIVFRFFMNNKSAKIEPLLKILFEQDHFFGLHK